MDYVKLNDSIEQKVLAAVALINNIEIAPEIRQRNLEILFREVGSAVYDKVYDMNAFDYEIQHTRGKGIEEARYYGLAKKAAASVSTGALALPLLVRNFLDTSALKAQSDASTNARQYGKRTRVVRKLGRTEKTCEYCEGLANGSPYEGDRIEPLIFGRHRGCDCEIYTEGFKSRNGLLDNYIKDKDGNRV